MGFEDSFSFFPFGALYCLTLICFVAVATLRSRHRYKSDNQQDRNITSILKSRLIKGEIDEAEYERLKEFLAK
ncbi:hypothetical protein [Bacillus sp. T33-2]|uniref:hypothetical protein n=1 Tax=Bacillus sp. T33-2 TaxID=2054168 RepID=UPI000C76C909|nr:hypothetical protein [Bacillus sp. T33-2]PLR99055.1 hypothetical protein CVD19_03030 [Bacillus sp. T33-2]